jgi:hypothetical protein
MHDQEFWALMTVLGFGVILTAAITVIFSIPMFLSWVCTKTDAKDGILWPGFLVGVLVCVGIWYKARYG